MNSKGWADADANAAAEKGSPEVTTESEELPISTKVVKIHQEKAIQKITNRKPTICNCAESIFKPREWVFRCWRGNRSN